MKRWAKVLEALCEVAKEEKVNLYILEADASLKWYGLPLEEICNQDLLDAEDAQLYKTIKSKVENSVEEGEYIALVNVFNFHADIYGSSSPRFALCQRTARPYCVARDSFRVGFFDSKEQAVDFFLKVAKKLKEKGIHFNLFYT